MATANTVNTLVTLPGVNGSQGIDAYAGGIFQLAVKIGVLVAILSNAWWGLRTILSKVPGFKGEGKERMIDALLGLGLLYWARAVYLPPRLS